jgi:hypothetical protein
MLHKLSISKEDVKRILDNLIDANTAEIEELTINPEQMVYEKLFAVTNQRAGMKKALNCILQEFESGNSI